MPARKGDRNKRKPAEGTISASASKRAKQQDQKTGLIFSLGQGDVGQLGLGEDILERKRAAPIIEVADVRFTQVTCGGMHSVGVTDIGEVYTWGCNDDGALGRESEDGEEFSPGKVKLPVECVVKQASAGDSHTAVLSTDGCVYAWGAYRDGSGQIGLTTAQLGKKHEIVLIYPDPSTVGSGDLDRAVKVVSGNDHTVILTENGHLYTCGSGEQGQLGRLKECFGHRGGRRGLKFLLSPQIVRFRKKIRFSDVFAGSFNTFALRRDSNDVYAWGLNNYGQLGSGTNDTYFSPEIIKPLSDIRALSNSNFMIEGGQHHAILCNGQGAIYSMGRSEYGRLGLGKDAQESPLPCKIESLSDRHIKYVACGEAVSFAITDDGHLFSWGLGTSLQLGVGDEEDILEPTLVKSKNIDPQNDEVLSVSSGGQHTLILIAKRETVNKHT